MRGRCKTPSRTSGLPVDHVVVVGLFITTLLLHKQLHNFIQELRFQTNEKEGALQSLRMRQRLKCGHGCELGRGQSTPRKAEQREEPDALRAAL